VKVMIMVLILKRIDCLKFGFVLQKLCMYCNIEKET